MLAIKAEEIDASFCFLDDGFSLAMVAFGAGVRKRESHANQHFLIEGIKNSWELFLRLSLLKKMLLVLMTLVLCVRACV